MCICISIYTIRLDEPSDIFIDLFESIERIYNFLTENCQFVAMLPITPVINVSCYNGFDHLRDRENFNS